MFDFTRAQTGDSHPPVPLHGLTTRQRQMIEAIAAIEKATGEPCGARQLARKLRIDESTVREYLPTLFRSGWLKTPNAPISLRHRPFDS